MEARKATNTTDTNTERGRYVTGLFRDRESAEGAYGSLNTRGYNTDDIDLLMTDETRNKHFNTDNTVAETELGSKALEGTAVGGAIGGTVGAIAAAIAAIGTSLAIPGLGIVIAGPIAAALAGAGAGGATGGLIGALIGAGIPEERAKIYDEGVRNGGIVMGVKSRNDEDADYFENEWRNKYRGESVYR